MNNNIQVTKSEEKTGKVSMTFEFSFPNEAGEERDRVFETIGRIMREALPIQEEREQFLNDLKNARRKAFEGGSGVEPPPERQQKPGEGGQQ